MWCNTARDMPLAHVGQGQFLSIGSMLFVCFPSSIPSNNEFRIALTFAKISALRLRGPLKVKATPNLAVRVGNTQSAWVTVRGLRVNVCQSQAYHINTQCNANQQIWSRRSGLAARSKRFKHLLQNLRPWSSGALSAQKLAGAFAEETDILTI